MENAGLIIRHLRNRSGLSVRNLAKKIGKSAGWLSEIENGTGTARLTESEFDRIVTALDGNRDRSMFKTWAASVKNQRLSDHRFDGAVLRFIREKKELTLVAAAKAAGISPSHLSALEYGLKPVSQTQRNRLMATYGYSPSSFKNLATDPVRSKAVPLKYKMQILLNQLDGKQMESAFACLREMFLSEKKTAST